MAHLGFARRFSTGTPKLRVYNPRPEEHGWSSPHTVIEIVNDDMPFLVDSVTMELNRQGYTLHLLNHPIFAAKRDRRAARVLRPSAQDERSESLIHVEIDREIDPRALKAIGDGLLCVLADVRAAVEDWRAMRARLVEIVQEDRRPRRSIRGSRRSARLPRMGPANHFTFLGYREYELATVNGEDQLRSFRARAWACCASRSSAASRRASRTCRRS
jgi:glutamate dehydrogenase